MATARAQGGLQEADGIFEKVTFPFRDVFDGPPE